MKAATHDSGRVTLGIIVIIAIGVRLALPPPRFADFDSYVILSDYLAFRPSSDWLTFEPLSSATMLLLRRVFGTGYAGVEAAHWLLSALFVISLRGFLRRGLDWRGVALVSGLYGPLLAFVLVRATPAYCLVTLAVIEGFSGRWRSLIYGSAAILFHISAILAFPAIVVHLAQSKLRFVDAILRSQNFAIAVVLLALFTVVSVSSTLFESIGAAISIFSVFIGKYSVYLDGISSGSAVVSGSDTRFHFYYSIAVSVFVIASIVQRNELVIRARGYLIVSYALFLALSLSPVAAFRQSIFWMFPALLVFPWREHRIFGFGSVAIAAMAVALFMASLNSVIQQ